MHVSDLHRRSVESFAGRLDHLASLGPDGWHGPTPCPDWDVRELLSHVVYEDLWTVPMMEGVTIDEVGDRFDGDLLGEDPVTAARAACDAAITAAATGIVAGETVHLSYGDTPAEEYAYQLAADHLIHGWDLAAATGGDRTIAPDLVTALAEWFADREDLYRSAGATGPRPDVADPEDPQGRLLLAFGRDPGWSPS
jgi:uncharacterized protein (TIGR03086 family)